MNMLKKLYYFLPMIVIASGMTNQANALERVNYDELSNPFGPYVHAVKYNKVLYLSGLSAFGSEAQSGTVGDQVLEIFDRISIITQAEGRNLDDIVKVTVFVREGESLGEVRKALLEVYNGHFPASSLVYVSSFFDESVSVEIESVIALRD